MSEIITWKSALKTGEILQKLEWLAYLVEAIQYLNRYDIYFIERSSDFSQISLKISQKCSKHTLVENSLSKSFKYL